MKAMVLTSLLLMLTGAVSAQDRVQGVQCGVERDLPGGALTEGTYNRLTRIYEDIGDDLFEKALEDLQSLLGRRLDDYEKATVNQAIAHVHSQLENYDAAIDYFQTAIDLNRLPNEQHYDMIRQVALLHYTVEDYREALRQLDLWFCVVPEDDTDVADVWVMKASIHAQIEEHREALDAIDTAIGISDQPQEQWYQLKLGMHLELHEFRPASEVLRTLIRMNPDRKDYWMQLTSILVELGNERDARAVLSLAYRKGLLDRQNEIKQLAGMQQQHDAPRKAAEIMQDGLEQGIVENTRQNWEMTAGAWYEARELDKALEAYERAGRQASEGTLDLQRGFILVDLERWEEAEQALERALELGGLSNNETGNAHLLRGTAKYNLGRYDEALEAFNEATNYGKVESAAREWINHVQQERSRRASS